MGEREVSDTSCRADSTHTTPSLGTETQSHDCGRARTAGLRTTVEFMASTWTVEDGKAVWDGRRLSEWTDVLVDEFVTEFDPTAVWLYGSVARGDDNGDSDIDILVVLDSFDPGEAIDLKVRAFNAATTSAPFDVSFTDPDRYRDRRRVAGTIERATVLDGRCLYRRD